jgi:hypothetical protein
MKNGIKTNLFNNQGDHRLLFVQLQVVLDKIKEVLQTDLFCFQAILKLM